MSWYTKVDRRDSDKPKEYPMLEPGVYRFTVSKAQFKHAKSTGNPMVALELIVHGADRTYIVFDNLVSTEKMDWKIRHFCDSVGLEDEYQAETFADTMCPGKQGIASVGVEKAKPSPTGGTYPAKNVVLDYVMTLDGAVKSDLSTAQQPAPAPFVDSDIPF